jgi:hypothetical protein
MTTREQIESKRQEEIFSRQRQPAPPSDRLAAQTYAANPEPMLWVRNINTGEVMMVPQRESASLGGEWAALAYRPAIITPGRDTHRAGLNYLNSLPRAANQSYMLTGVSRTGQDIGGREILEVSYQTLGPLSSQLLRRGRRSVVRVFDDGTPVVGQEPTPKGEARKQDDGPFSDVFPLYEVRGQVREEVAVQMNVQQINWRMAAQRLVAKGLSKAQATQVVNYARGRGISSDRAAQPGSMVEAVGALWGKSAKSQQLAKDLIASEAMGTYGGEMTKEDALIFDTRLPQAAKEEFDPNQYLADALAAIASSISGGGGGSRTTRIYTPPDRREVEDLVRGMVAGLVGFADEGRVQKLTDSYMSADRRAFDKPDLGLSPRAEVLEQIRKAEDYQRIHKLRPDAVPETEWVTQRQGVAMQAGMTAQRAAQFGITQAQVGATGEAVAEGVMKQEFGRTGQMAPEFANRFRQTAAAMFKGVR